MREIVDRECLWCKKQYRVYGSDASRGRRIYCSRKCYAQDKMSKTNHTPNSTCKQCGTNFFTYECHIRRGNGNYCSKQCYLAYKRANKTITKRIRAPRTSNRQDAKEAFRLVRVPLKDEPVKQCKECGSFIFDRMQKYYCCNACFTIANKKSRTIDSVCIECGTPFRACKYDSAKGMGKFCSMKCLGHNRSKFNHYNNGHSRSNGGKRGDLGGLYFRSSWEANYARYLNWLESIGHIKSWQFEPHVFKFPVSKGTTSYTPDFKVVKHDGTHEWHEIKGWMDKVSATKLKRMAKYFPAEVVIVLGKKEYYSIAREMKNAIPNWERDNRHSI